jgi:serine/threonine protein kinase
VGSTSLRKGDPTQVGRYRIVARLGEGGSGTVFEGVSDDGRHVAVKVLHGSLVEIPGLRERLRREAAALRRVKGSRTVRVLEVDASGSLPFLAMELVEGMNLEEHLSERGLLRGALLWAFAEGLLDGIQEVHEAGVIHRDLKPSNILFGPGGIRLVDFGISSISEMRGMTGTGGFVGTAAWMSPEQILGDQVGPSSDIFNFGLVVAYAATGSHPFGQGRSDAVMYRIVHEKPDLSGLRGQVKAIVNRCLGKALSDRPTVDEIRQLFPTASLTPSTERPERNLDNRTRVVQRTEQGAALLGDKTNGRPGPDPQVLKAQSESGSRSRHKVVSDWPADLDGLRTPIRELFGFLRPSGWKGNTLRLGSPNAATVERCAELQTSVERHLSRRLGFEVVIELSEERAGSVRRIPPPQENEARTPRPKEDGVRTPRAEPASAVPDVFAVKQPRSRVGWLTAVGLVALALSRGIAGGDTPSDNAPTTTINGGTSTSSSSTNSRLRLALDTTLTNRLKTLLDREFLARVDGPTNPFDWVDDALWSQHGTQLDCGGKWISSRILRQARYREYGPDSFYTRSFGNYFSGVKYPDDYFAVRADVQLLTGTGNKYGLQDAVWTELGLRPGDEDWTCSNDSDYFLSLPDAQDVTLNRCVKNANYPAFFYLDGACVESAYKGMKGVDNQPIRRTISKSAKIIARHSYGSLSGDQFLFEGTSSDLQTRFAALLWEPKTTSSEGPIMVFVRVQVDAFKDYNNSWSSEVRFLQVFLAGALLDQISASLAEALGS